MPFNSTTYKLRLYNKILYVNIIAEFSYFNYETKGCKYFIILDLNLKCTKYIQLGWPYVNIFQTSLDKTCKKYKKKVKNNKKELATIIL